jgi:hypothetical protein
VSAACAPPYEGIQRKLSKYSASKTQGEQGAWKRVKANKARFILRTVLPTCNMGRVLSIAYQGAPSTVGCILWCGFDGAENIKANPPQYHIRVQDNARVHVAALGCKDVENEWLFTLARPFNWNEILPILRNLYYRRKFIDIVEVGHDLSTVTNERAEQLLKRWEIPDGRALRCLKDAVDGRAQPFHHQNFCSIGNSI